MHAKMNEDEPGADLEKSAEKDEKKDDKKLRDKQVMEMLREKKCAFANQKERRAWLKKKEQSGNNLLDMGGLDLGMGAMGKLAEAGLEKMNTVVDDVKPGGRKKKNRNVELSALARMEVQDEKKLIQMIDELVDCFFMYDINQVPKEFRETEKKDSRSYEEMESDIFQRECGENLMNKKNNRFLFKLL